MYVHGLKSTQGVMKVLVNAWLLEIKKSNSQVDLEDISSLKQKIEDVSEAVTCLLYTSPSPRDRG